MSSPSKSPSEVLNSKMPTLSAIDKKTRPATSSCWSLVEGGNAKVRMPSVNCSFLLPLEKRKLIFTPMTFGKRMKRSSCQQRVSSSSLTIPVASREAPSPHNTIVIGKCYIPSKRVTLKEYVYIEGLLSGVKSPKQCHIEISRSSEITNLSMHCRKKERI